MKDGFHAWYKDIEEFTEETYKVFLNYIEDRYRYIFYFNDNTYELALIDRELLMACEKLRKFIWPKEGEYPSQYIYREDYSGSYILFIDEPPQIIKDRVLSISNLQKPYFIPKEDFKLKFDKTIEIKELPPIVPEVMGYIEQAEQSMLEQFAIPSNSPKCDCHQSKGKNKEIPHANWCKTKRGDNG